MFVIKLKLLQKLMLGLIIVTDKMDIHIILLFNQQRTADRLNVKSKINNITIFYFIFFTFEAYQTCLFGRLKRTVGL